MRDRVGAVESRRRGIGLGKVASWNDGAVRVVAPGRSRKVLDVNRSSKPGKVVHVCNCPWQERVANLLGGC
jgi:hypothetical protein